VTGKIGGFFNKIVTKIEHGLDKIEEKWDKKHGEEQK
jgi:hypothetical protein